MYELKKNGKVFTSKSVGTGPSSYEKRIYRAAVSQRFRNTGLEHPNNSPTESLKIKNDDESNNVFDTQNFIICKITFRPC